MIQTFRAGVDIGGTFTDIVLLDENGERYTKKVSSTVDDYARAIVDGLSELLAEIGGGRIVELLHGTTVASNAILGAVQGREDRVAYHNPWLPRRAGNPQPADAAASTT